MRREKAIVIRPFALAVDLVSMILEESSDVRNVVAIGVVGLDGDL